MHVYPGYADAGLENAGVRRAPSVTPAANLKSIGMFCERSVGEPPIVRLQTD
jgi:hypothetical protein